MADYEETHLPIGKLLLDPNNYRFQDTQDYVSADSSRFHEKSVQERAYRALKTTANLLQLKASIIRNGFIPVERIVLREYSPGSHEYVVIEGNRRVAALKWIEEDNLAGVNIPGNVKETLSKIPVLIVSGGADGLEYKALMGVRHVSGISQWGGYQRAKLIVELLDTFKLDSTEVAERLAMTVHEVNRRYRAFKALQQMQFDEESGSYAQAEMYPLFHEAVALPAVKDWLGWDEKLSEFTKDAEREQFYSLLIPTSAEDGSEKKEPKITTYQQVRQLREILAKPEARHILFDPNKTFLDALTVASPEDLSKFWLSHVASATQALERLSVTALISSTVEEREEIKNLISVASQLLQSYEKLK